jgi:hypothetical protein
LRARFDLAFPDAVTTSFNKSNIGVMSERVQQSGDTDSIGKDNVPVAEYSVSCNQNRAGFIAAIDDFKNQVGGVGVIGEVSQLVDAEQARAGIVAEFTAADLWGVGLQIGPVNPRPCGTGRCVPR